MNAGLAADTQDPPRATGEQVDVAAVMFGLLADPTRLRIVSRLARGGIDVAGLADTVGCSATAASQHLARLRLAGLVAGSRDGRRMIYRLRDPRLRPVLAAVFPDGGAGPQVGRVDCPSGKDGRAAVDHD